MSTKDDPFSGPHWEDFVNDVTDNLIPGLSKSAAVVNFLPEGGAIDVRYAVELGASIMLDKPIMVVVMAGTKVPEHIVRVADEIVEVTGMNDAAQEQIQAAIIRLGLGRSPS